MALTQCEITHKNSLNAEVVWTVQLIDTRISEGSTIQFESESGSISYGLNGSPGEILPGVYPSTFKITMMVMSLQNGIIQNFAESTEKDWVMKVYRGEVLEFVGYVLPDQCSWEDLSFPYALEITASDGFQSIQNNDFKQRVGRIAYQSCLRTSGVGDNEY